jgi:hypothetical protein
MPAYLRIDTARLALFAQQTCTHCYCEWYDHAVVNFIDTGNGCKIELICPKLLPTYIVTRGEAQLPRPPPKQLESFRYQRMLPAPPRKEAE